MDYNQLSDYENSIAEALHSLYGYNKEDAYKKVHQYLTVLRRLDRYDNAEDRAGHLDSIIQRNISPEKWNAHIDKLRKTSKNQDPTIVQQEPPVEGGQHLEERIKDLEREVADLRKTTSIDIKTLISSVRALGLDGIELSSKDKNIKRSPGSKRKIGRTGRH